MTLIIYYLSRCLVLRNSLVGWFRVSHEVVAGLLLEPQSSEGWTGAGGRDTSKMASHMAGKSLPLLQAVHGAPEYPPSTVAASPRASNPRDRGRSGGALHDLTLKVPCSHCVSLDT